MNADLELTEQELEFVEAYRAAPEWERAKVRLLLTRRDPESHRLAQMFSDGALTKQQFLMAL